MHGNTGNYLLIAVVFQFVDKKPHPGVLGKGKKGQE
jgi:hypothetical protein